MQNVALSKKQQYSSKKLDDMFVVISSAWSHNYKHGVNELFSFNSFFPALAMRLLSLLLSIDVKKTTVYTHVNGDRRSQFAHRKQQK